MTKNKMNIINNNNDNINDNINDNNDDKINNNGNQNRNNKFISYLHNNNRQIILFPKKIKLIK